MSSPLGGTSPWLNLQQAAARLGPNRSKRFLAKEIKAGRLRAARIGGRGEYVIKAEWVDEYLESMAAPVMVHVRRRA